MRRWVPKIASGSAPTPDILWWKMSDGSGVTVTAAVGPAGTTNASWVTGASGSGSALDFDGTTQSIVSNSNVTYGVNIVTVTCWLWLDSIATDQIFINSTSTPAVTRSATFTMYVSSAGNIVCDMAGTNGAIFCSKNATAPATGAWVCVAFVVDQAANSSAGEIKIYYNGALQSTSGSSSKTTAPNFAANILLLGGFTASSFFFNGRMDDLRIYARELTPTEIAQVVADPQ